MSGLTDGGPMVKNLALAVNGASGVSKGIRICKEIVSNAPRQQMSFIGQV